MSSEFVRYAPEIETIDPHLDETLAQIIDFERDLRARRRRPSRHLRAQPTSTNRRRPVATRRAGSAAGVGPRCCNLLIWVVQR
jgi:hypothetical protein